MARRRGSSRSAGGEHREEEPAGKRALGKEKKEEKERKEEKEEEREKERKGKNKEKGGGRTSLQKTENEGGWLQKGRGSERKKPGETLGFGG